ncbi:MAG TPA: hypothetical protein ENH82_01920 [bacterium]|nr:hypothetical protein [bacterium]
MNIAGVRVGVNIKLIAHKAPWEELPGSLYINITYESQTRMKATEKHFPIPLHLTEPGWRFQREYERLFSFIVYVTQLATSTDEKAKIAVKALYESDDPERYKKTLEKIKKYGAAKALKKLHRTIVLEMTISSGANNFLVYISEFLALVFKSKPETLRSSETVRLEEVLKHSTMEDLIKDLAERRVNQLSYQGMCDLTEYLSARLSFKLFPKQDDLEHAVKIIESRNIIVHNRGIINNLFISRVHNDNYTLGEYLNLDTDQIFDDLEFLAIAVYDIDLRSSDKFGLKCVLRDAFE